MRWPIRNQLLAPLLVLLVGVVAGSAWTATTYANRAWNRIENRVRAIARSFEESKYPLENEMVRDNIKRYSGADYYLVPNSGKSVSTLGTTEQLALPADTPVFETADQLRLGPRLVVDDKAYRCSGLRRKSDVVYILYPDDQLQDAVWEAIWPVLILGGSVGLASVLVAFVVGQRLSRRLRGLERRTRLIAAGDFSLMALPARNDEILDLTKSVNEMANRLAQYQETMRRTERLRLLGQVSGGLAHQLRNGVTGARLAIQLYMRESGGQTDHAALDVALRQLTLLETNLKRFLDLGNEKPLNREPCDLKTLVTEAVELLRPQCKHANIDLRWEPPDVPAIVLADRGQLEQLIFNILGNAVEAAGPDGRVQVQLSLTETAVVVQIADSGPGPPAPIADRLFEPFVTGKPEGVGLGLAVARQVAEALGGRITWGREADRTCFRIELPLAKRP